MMTAGLSLSQAAITYGGTLLYPDCHFARVCTDTRSLASGDLFVALRGENFDAHQFLESAALKACGMVVEKPNKCLAIPQWVVPNTLQALGQLAALARKPFTGPLIAITGSGGKTTVKDMLAVILRCKGEVLATQGNLNNHIGVPQTLLGLQAKHQYAVIEMGASAAGEIDYLCSIARPTIAVVTNVMPAHVASFGSLAGVASAKGEIYRGLDSAGTAILNLDEPWYEQWRSGAHGIHNLSFSVANSAADFYPSNVQFDIEACASFTLHSPLGEIDIKLAIPGAHNISNALAAAACAVAAGADLVAIAAGLAAMVAAPGRMQRKAGSGGARIIDDSYNANPGSVKAAIDALVAMPGKHYLVLGDMGELGPQEKAMHREVGDYARNAGVDGLYTSGPLSAETTAAFGAGGEHFATKADLAQALLPRLNADAVVLVKGSRSAAMEEVVAHIIEEND
ncbi:MAG: UDP-N-acetylmuramoyl-tripeptide--D-alanyl-D-alanine ligase [Gammaproteobacteria bacterium]|nr:UDP-N-acetylmuramoyl-tripeptide--D-alanyl-D-alanine ligase [Gammaproteobacteria bacterium]MBQ0838283.1 UDP-N-acetylmuramoyl-tripeptide--D-alanyl-D-alanine ligase [Gammaproteobacteria bacterium]